MNKRLLFSAIGAIALCVATSCGGGQSKSPANEETGSAATETAVSQEAEKSTAYDIERIKSIKQPTEADNDFLLDQYELVCKETKGMNGDEKKAYLMKKGEEGKVLALLIMGVENSKGLTEAQKERRAAIKEKYK